MNEILLFYKYILIDDLSQTLASQFELCKSLNLKGRILLSHEGVNGTLEGSLKDTNMYIEKMNDDPIFNNIDFKRSESNGESFPKLSIKIRNEIVSGHLGSKDLNPNITTGNRMSPLQLHELIKSKDEFYIVDMRNDYEQKVGRFNNSILSQFENFRDLPSILKTIDHLKDKKIVTVCTGGVRCEKASGFLINNGFTKVYQLDGGIVSYMKLYPNEDFLGKLYVFDQRIIMGYNTQDPNHIIIGKCERCKNTSEHYINCDNLLCHKHFILCENCINEIGNAYCNDCEKKDNLVNK